MCFALNLRSHIVLPPLWFSQLRNASSAEPKASNTGDSLAMTNSSWMRRVRFSSLSLRPLFLTVMNALTISPTQVLSM